MNATRLYPAKGCWKSSRSAGRNARPATLNSNQNPAPCLVPFPKPFLAGLMISMAAIFGAAGDEPKPADSTTNQTDLASLPIEELMKIEVTTGARHPETLSSSPAAITVITQDDIRRSGVMTIPEALRLAPGMEV